MEGAHGIRGCFHCLIPCFPVSGCNGNARSSRAGTREFLCQHSGIPGSFIPLECPTEPGVGRRGAGIPWIPESPSGISASCTINHGHGFKQRGENPPVFPGFLNPFPGISYACLSLFPSRQSGPKGAPSAGSKFPEIPSAVILG